MQLVKYEAAKRALSEAVFVDEVKDVRDKSIAVAAYAKLAKDSQLEIDARELRVRAERRLGQLLADMPKAKPTGDNQHGKKDRVIGKPEAPTLEEIGIDKNLANTARVAASIDEDEFEETLEDFRERGELVTVGKIARPHVTHNSDNDEWYTPAVYIDAARDVMGGIDLDPCSCDVAQKNVKAKEYFTKEDNGLEYEWAGRIWMNPPYGKGRIAPFCEELVAGVDSGRIKQACVLVNNATDTAWFQSMIAAADAVCLVKGRIKFLNSAGEPADSPLQGQAFLYFGSQVDKFVVKFAAFGVCLVRKTF